MALFSFFKVSRFLAPLVLFLATLVHSAPAQTVVHIETSDPRALESGATFGRFQVYRSGETNNPLNVNYRLGGTATPDLDYSVSMPTPLEIPIEFAARPLTITPIDDALIEGDETVVVTLLPGDGYTLSGRTSATVTIVDKPVVMVSASDPTASELDGDWGSFNFLRSGDISKDLKVDFEFLGTAELGTDYTPDTSGTLTIPAGATSGTVRIIPISDALIEGDETVILRILPGDASYNIGVPDSATVTIRDKSTVTVTAPDGLAAEVGLDPGSFQLYRTGDLDRDLTVYFLLTGSAGEGVDYTAEAVSAITIRTGETVRTVQITPLDDALLEGDEEVILTIIAQGGQYNVGTPQSARIIISDKPAVRLSTPDPLASESGPDPGAFRIHRTGSTAQPLTVAVAWGGTATAGVDYTGGTQETITIPAGSDSQDVTVTPIAQPEVENEETVVLTLQANAAYNLGEPQTATVTILDQPTITVTVPDASASEPGTNTGEYLISRTGDTSLPLVVSFVMTGTALNETDYHLSSASPVTLPAGESSRAIRLTPINDLIVEETESATLTLVEAPNFYYVGEANTATIQILDKPVVTVTAEDPMASESDNDTGRFRIARSGPTNAPLVVSLSLSGTATMGEDYGITDHETVTIPVGASSADVTVTPVTDARNEGNETVILTVTTDNAVYGVGHPPSATITIIDMPTVSVRAAVGFAPESGRTPGLFVLERSGDPSISLAVNFVLGGSAIQNVDYVLDGASPVIIPAGATSATLAVTAIDDFNLEEDETVVLTLVANAVTYNVGSPAAATILILDNDKTPVIEPIADQTIFAYEPYTGPTPKLIQGSADAWQLIEGPEGMTIDAETGVVVWINPILTVSQYKVTLRAINWAGQDEESWMLTIIPNPATTTEVDWDLYKIVYKRNGVRMPTDDFRTTMGLVIQDGGKRDTLKITPRVKGADVPPLPLVYSDTGFKKIYTTVELGKLEAPKRVWKVTAKKSHVAYMDVGEIRTAKMAARGDVASESTSPTLKQTSIISRNSERTMAIRLAGVILENLASEQNVESVVVSSKKYKKKGSPKQYLSLGGIGPAERILTMVGDNLDSEVPIPQPVWNDQSMMVAWQMLSIRATGCPITPDVIDANVRKIRGRGLAYRINGRAAPVAGHVWVGRLISGADGQKFVVKGGDFKVDNCETENPIRLIKSKYLRTRSTAHIRSVGGVVGYETDVFSDEATSGVYTMRVASRLGNIQDVHGDLGIFGVFMSGSDVEGNPNYKGTMRLFSTKHPLSAKLPYHAHPVGIYGEAHLSPQTASNMRFKGDETCVRENRFRLITTPES